MTPATLAEPVAIGDTFVRAGHGEDPWEVTAENKGFWTLTRGASLVFTTSAQLLDMARWVRTRAL